MATLEMLTPGDRVKLSGRSAIFIGLGLRPGSSTLRTVVWKLDTGEFSVDVLRYNQEVGELDESDTGSRDNRLMSALTRGGSVV
jgi:hypothetical protein